MWEWYFILKGNEWGLEWLSTIFRWKMKWKWRARLDQLRSDHAMKFIDVVDVFKLKHGKNMVKRCTINQIIGAVIFNCKNSWLQHYIGTSNYYFKLFSIYSCCNEFKAIHRFVYSCMFYFFLQWHIKMNAEETSLNIQKLKELRIVLFLMMLRGPKWCFLIYSIKQK